MFLRKRPERVVIVGAGQAGVQAVASLRAEGFKGIITLFGHEPHAPYQRPPLSKDYLAGGFERERLFLRPEAFFTDESCELQLGMGVVAIDRLAKRVRLVDGTNLEYDKILLATGARPRLLNHANTATEGIYYLRNMDDTDALRPRLVSGSRLAVIGGGYIGLEVAAVARERGLSVTVIEAADRVMSRTVSPLVSSFYEEVHRARGVRILTGAQADKFEGRGRIEAVHVAGERIPADAVLAAIGAVPNSELAEQAGLACDNGIVVDEFARTSDPGIFAAGDCTNHPDPWVGRVRLESVQNAVDQAKVAAAGLAGKPKPYRDVPWFWSDQYDLKLQIAGLARAGDVTVLRGDTGARKFAVFHFREGKVAAVEAINATQDYIVGRKLITSGKPVSRERLADPNVPIKSFV